MDGDAKIQPLPSQARVVSAAAIQVAVISCISYLTAPVIVRTP